MKSKYAILIILLLLAPVYAFAKSALHITINGISGSALQNVQSKLDRLEQTYGKEPSAQDIQAFYQAAPNQIKDALKPFATLKRRFNLP